MANKHHLALTRINTIMKSSSDVETVSKESALIMSKATELFIKNLTQQGCALNNNGRKLIYKHLAEVVHRDSRYDFLRDIMPKKITVLEFKKIMAKKNAVDSAEETSSSDESSSEESEDITSSE